MKHRFKASFLAVTVLCLLGYKFWCNSSASTQIEKISPEKPLSKSPEHSKEKAASSVISKASTPKGGFDWMIAYEQLSKVEVDEFAVIPAEVKNFFTDGKISPDKMNDFRAAVYKFDNRALAHAGRLIANAEEELTKTQQGSEQVVDLIDVLVYFARVKENYPLAVDIIRDIGTRPIKFDTDLSPEEKSKANITIQMFEQYARFEPESALRFVIENIDRSSRGPYIAYLRTGMALAGFKLDDINKRLSIFS